MHPGEDARRELPAVDDHILAEGCGYELDEGVLVARWREGARGGASRELPAVDARLVRAGCGYEIFEGRLVRVPPLSASRAARRERLALLLELHVTAELDVAIELPTRTSEISDIAPGASVVPRAPDPRTDGRQLEHLAFEVVDAGSIEYAGRKAASLIGRGVRRVLAIDVERERVLEWSQQLGAWRVLDAGASIADRSFVAPLPVEALLHEAKIDRAILRALLARHAAGGAAERPAAPAERLAEGFAEGWAEVILAMLVARDLCVSWLEQEQLLVERDLARLERWSARAATCASAAELLAVR